MYIKGNGCMNKKVSFYLCFECLKEKTLIR